MPCACLCAQVVSPVRLCATPWTVAHQAPLSTDFPRQEYWGGLPFPPPGDLPDSGTEPVSPMGPDRQILSPCAIWDIYICIYICIIF